MRAAVPLPFALLLVFALAWLVERGTVDVPFWAVVGWTLGVLASGVWLGVNAQASVQGPPRDDGEDGMAR